MIWHVVVLSWSPLRTKNNKNKKSKNKRGGKNQVKRVMDKEGGERGKREGNTQIDSSRSSCKTCTPHLQ